MKTNILIALCIAVCLPVGAAAEEERETMLDEIPIGEFWYAMKDGGGKSIGYARLENARGDDGSLSVSWELKLAPEGGTYEESRTLVIDGDRRIVSSSYHVFGNVVCVAGYEGDEFRVTVVRDGKPDTSEAEPPAVGAVTGMGFVFASAVPREEGGRIAMPELNEAEGLRPVGETVFTWEGSKVQDWEGERIPVHRVLMKRADGTEVPIELAEDGRILRSDWGGGNVMELSKTDTSELFRPPPPAIRVVTAGEQLVMKGELPDFTPEEVFDHFTKPALLTNFWPQEAEVDPEVGGRYRLFWPGPGWRLVGEIREFEPGKRLAFTWVWEHAPDAPGRLVTMELTPRDEGGTLVKLTHGPYGDTEAEAKERDGHVQGWEYTFGRLRALR